MTRKHTQRRTKQHGAAMLLLLVTLLLGAAAIFYGLITATPPEIERDRKTAEALSIAKAALIGHATTLALTSATAIRLGDLPCPDTNDDGIAEGSCGSGDGTTGQTSRIGRLRSEEHRLNSSHWKQSRIASSA